MGRILIIFLPYIFGWLWEDLPAFSTAWSLAGSVFIVFISHTLWFRQSPESVPVTHRLLRPLSLYQFWFLVPHVVGGTIYTLHVAGYYFWDRIAIPQENALATIAVCQRLMLLAHASVIAGMKLVGFRYGQLKYVIPYVPPYSLIVTSFISLGAATVAATIPGLKELSVKFLDISFVAIMVETWLSVRRGHFTNIIVTLALLFFNFISMILSGWKGLVLWSSVALGSMFYPMMPRRVVLGGVAFVVFWAMYLHPFGQMLRPLTWTYGIEQDTAVAISIDYALNMPLEERLANVWQTMIERNNELWMIEKYVKYVPDIRPYYGFDIIQQALVALIPRILWADKPNLERLAMERVYEAGVVSEGVTVSAKSSFYVDAYLSGGAPAIVLACLIYGMVGMLLSRLCERLFGGYDIGTCLIYTSLFAFWVNSGVNFTFFVGAIWGSLLAMFLIFLCGRFMGLIVPARPLEQIGEGDEEVAREPAIYPHIRRAN